MADGLWQGRFALAALTPSPLRSGSEASGGVDGFRGMGWNGALVPVRMDWNAVRQQPDRSENGPCLRPWQGRLSEPSGSSSGPRAISH